MWSLRLFLCSCILLVFLCGVIAPPPRRHPEPQAQAAVQEEEDDPSNLNEETLGLEYRNYLEEVVRVLEDDPEFKVILENATEEDLKSGAVADRLHVVDPLIRTRLDELKRLELERLRKKATEAYELSNGLDRDSIKEPLHLEHSNPHTFREEDLRRLVKKTAHDLEELDRKRQEDFKKYEMEKEFNRTQELKKLDKPHREEAEKKHEVEQEEHKKHEKVHHPLSEDQLEEVWEEQDDLEKEDFDPETFFRIHDVDGNEQLDPMETMALFKSELDKMYNGSDADPREREEEMNKMRETTYNETDTDRDGLISLEEFIASTKHDDYKNDQGWEGIPDREHEYEQKEYDEYSQHREKDLADSDHHDGQDKEDHHEAQKDDHHEAQKEDHHEAQKEDHHEVHKDDHHEAQQDDHHDAGGQPDHQQPAGGHAQLSLPIGNPPPQQQQLFANQQFNQQGIPLQQQQQQGIPLQQQQGIPIQQQQQQGIPVQYQQGIPVQQQHGIPVQYQQGIPVQQQQGIPVQQQHGIPVQYQQRIPVQHQQGIPVQQQHGMPVQQQQGIPVQQQHGIPVQQQGIPVQQQQH